MMPTPPLPIDGPSRIGDSPCGSDGSRSGAGSRLRLLLGALLLPVAAALPSSAPAQSIGDLRTPLEESGFTTYTSHEEMLDYLYDLQARSTDLRIGTYGDTWEGRELPYLVLSRPAVTQPWEAWTLGRPIVALNANVHGGERTLRESLLILLRDLATPGTEANALLDHLVIVVAPQINPDGFEATPRGQRGNAWGIDMNRDWIKRENPSLTQYAMKVLGEWRPHLFVDGHNGGAFPYELTYQCPTHASPDQRLTQLCDEEIFPAIERKLNTVGYKSWYYASGTPTRWNVGGYDARIGRNYGGFANMIGILFESPPHLDIETGVKAGVLGFEAVLEYMRDHGDRAREMVRRARVETIEQGRSASGEVVVEMEYGPQPKTVTYQIGERGEDGQMRAVTVTNDSLMSLPIPTKTRPRPFAYILPRDAVDAVAMLRRHGITVETLRDSLTLEVEAYRMEDISWEQAYNHTGSVRLTVADEPVRASRHFPVGSFVVQTGQMLGRVVEHMLEPETNDNVIYWNTMDAWLPLAAFSGDPTAMPRGPGGQGAAAAPDPLVPFFKLMQPTPLPMRMIP